MEKVPTHRGAPVYKKPGSGDVFIAHSHSEGQIRKLYGMFKGAFLPCFWIDPLYIMWLLSVRKGEQGQGVQTLCLGVAFQEVFELSGKGKVFGKGRIQIRLIPVVLVKELVENLY